jgi:phage nucleotide-binding protein
MQFSHSRVECHTQCPYKYKLRYLDRLDALLPDTFKNPASANPLILGSALHAGIEKGAGAAVKEYFMSYPIITNEHVNEAMKLEYLIPLVRQKLPDDGEFEVEISDGDFVGYLDYLVPAVRYEPPDHRPPLGVVRHDHEFILYDFKYSNNAAKYRESPQIHIYKYFFEKLNPGKRINEMFYLMIPKVTIKRGETESLEAYRLRVEKELSKIEPFLIPIDYDFNKVAGFLFGVKHALEDTVYPKNESYLCNWCEFQQYCEKGIDYMLLPKNERRNIEKVSKRTIWLYGSPFSGKTTFANKFPDPLMLNTDGNITFVDAPYIAIKNDVKAEGRMTKTTLAWEVFKGAIEELEKKDNDFKTIVVDLLEDLYEYCRLYMYQQMGITHESDDSFRAWDKVRTEFLSTLKRLMNLDYENIILISHEDTSKDITRKGGDKITAIKPNIQEKTANKVAGMVHIVARAIADGDVRTLSFKQNEVVFGGGRLNVTSNEIPLDLDAFMTIFDEASKNAAQGKTSGRASASVEKPRVSRGAEPAKETHPADAQDAPRNDGPQADTAGEIPAEEPKQSENKPAARTRKRRGA